MPIPASIASTTPAITPSGPGPLAKLIAMSKANPESDLAKHTLAYIKNGSYDAQATKEGIDLSWAGRPPIKGAVKAATDSIGALKTASEVASDIPKAPEDGSLMQRIGNDFNTRVDKGSDALVAANAGKQNMGSGILQDVGQGAGFVSDIGQEGAESLDKTFLGGNVGKIATAGLTALGHTAAAQEVASKLLAFKEAHPEAAGNLEAIFNIASLLPEGKGAEIAGDAAAKGAAKGVEVAAPAAEAAINATKTGLETAGKTVESRIPNVGDTRKAINDAKIALTKGGRMPQLDEAATRINTAASVSKANTERADAAGNPMRQGVGNTVIESPSKTYADYYQKTKDALGDTKKDNAIQDLGSKIGDLFKNVVGQRQAAGKELGAQLKTVEDKPIDISATQDAIHHDLADSKVAFNPKEGEIIDTGTQSKLTGADKSLLGKYMTQLHSLGDNPTVGDLDAFIGRIPREIKEMKATNNITFKTNAERIIGNSLDGLRSHFTQFPEYNAAREKFADLAQFTSQNAAKLGKITPSGDFAKDASLAKRSVQSNLDNGSKDFLMELGDRTGFPIVDHAVLALQAMKDAGDYRGASLLENTMHGALNGGKIPTKVTEMINTGAGHLIKAGAQKFMGTPYEQTLRYLESLEK